MTAPPSPVELPQLPEWKPYTPTIISGGLTGIAATGRYRVVGATVYIELSEPPSLPSAGNGE